MKKACKVFLVISIVLMALGLCLSVGSLAYAGFDLAKFSIESGELSEFDADIEGGGITDLVIDNVSERESAYRITLVPSSDADFHVAYGAYNEKDLRWEINNGTLRFYSNSKDWRDYIHFISFGVDTIPLTIEVPSSVRNVHCEADAAALTCGGLNLEGDLSCSSDAADIRLERIQAENLNVNCDFGAVEMTDITVHNLVIDADTCDVDLTSVFAEGAFDLFVDCGSITMEIVSALIVNVDADTCDVDFASLSADEKIIFEVDCGDINGTINDPQSAYTISVNVSAANSNLLPGGSGPKILDVTADTADVDIRFLK